MVFLNYTFYMKKNYARYCKLNINEKTNQFNLTEGGLDGTNFFSKCLSVLRFAAPIGLIYSVSKSVYLEYILNTSAFSMLSPLFASIFFSVFLMLPHTNFGNVYNSVLKNYFYKNKIKNYYFYIRSLEEKKLKTKNRNKKIYYEEIQKKETRSLLQYFEKQTKKFDKLTKTYYNKKSKKGYLDGIKGYALETLETRQETIDKFIFHNAKLFIELSPIHKDFIVDRFNKRLETIKNNEPYYDEYLWTIETGENLIKNDCINYNETTNYFENLKKFMESKESKVDFETMKSEPKSLKNYSNCASSTENNFSIYKLNEYEK